MYHNTTMANDHYDSVSLDLEKAMGRFRATQGTIFYLECIDSPLQRHHAERLVKFWTTCRPSKSSSSSSIVTGLNLFRVQWEDDATAVLCRYLRSSARPVRNVWFRSCDWEGDQLRDVVQALAAHGRLQHLALTGTSVTHVADLWHAVWQGNPGLQRFEVSGLRAAALGSTTSLATGLRQYGQCLTHLSIAGCHLEYATARPVLEILPTKLPKLTKLDLSDNQLTGPALTALAQLLHCPTSPESSGLVHLNLANNPSLFVDADHHHVDALGEVLAQNSGLQSLILRNCGINGYAFCRLARAMMTNTTLSYLDISVTTRWANEEFPLAFWESLSHWQGVRILELDASRIDVKSDLWNNALHRNVSIEAGGWRNLPLPLYSTVVDPVLRRNGRWRRARELLAESPDDGVWPLALSKLTAYPTATFCCLQERLADWRHAAETLEQKQDVSIHKRSSSTNTLQS